MNILFQGDCAYFFAFNYYLNVDVFHTYSFRSYISFELWTFMSIRYLYFIVLQTSQIQEIPMWTHHHPFFSIPNQFLPMFPIVVNDITIYLVVQAKNVGIIPGFSSKYLAVIQESSFSPSISN